MKPMVVLAREAVRDMPPERRFSSADADVIGEAADLLLSVEADVVRRFYDTVFAHPATAAVFSDGERPAREAALAQWWRRTVVGPLDENYFAWMALVGLVHLARGVSNPMMLAMTDLVADTVAEVAGGRMSARDAHRLSGAFRRLMSTSGAIISYGYDQAVASALYTIAGMPEALLQRLRVQEVREAVGLARQELVQ